MERHAFALEIIPGKLGVFRQTLGKVWPQAVTYMDHTQISNFSLWSIDNYVFGYFESNDAKKPEMTGQLKEIFDSFGEICHWISTPGEDMRLMYHDFGIVRENKELIRHRMFMTKLKPDCAEEYKARHEGLIANRHGIPDPGPDSNFSIWSAGGYIFGYNEIDITMEKDPTPDEEKFNVEWETRQLGIMDWISNDCDWLTKEIHSPSRRIAWHN